MFGFGDFVGLRGHGRREGGGEVEAVSEVECCDVAVVMVVDEEVSGGALAVAPVGSLHVLRCAGVSAVCIGASAGLEA